MKTSHKILLSLTALTAALALTGVLVFRHVTTLATALPDNSPSICKPGFAKGKRVVVAIGDSITHGKVSANYVDALAADPANAGTVFVNAGVNGELAWNALQRVDAVLACQPDVVTILIGGNDVNAKQSALEEASYIRDMRLPQAPDRAFFVQNLDALVARLQARPGLRIAMLSMAPNGEDLGSPSNQMLRAYNQDIQAVARRRGTEFLPLNDVMSQALKGHDSYQRCVVDGYQMEYAVLQHFVLGRTWKQAGQSMGYHLMSDCLHLNEDGAALVQQLIQRTLDNPPPAPAPASAIVGIHQARP